MKIRNKEKKVVRKIEWNREPFNYLIETIYKYFPWY